MRVSTKTGRLLCVTSALAACLLTSCGGSGTDEPGGAASTSPTPTSTVSPAPAVGGDTTVRMLPRAFDPKDITVRTGSKVTWQDTGTPDRHNVVFVGTDGKTDKALSHEQRIPKGTAVVTTFAAAGQYRYQCQYHSLSISSGMVGVVRVV